MCNARHNQKKFFNFKLILKQIKENSYYLPEAEENSNFSMSFLNYYAFSPHRDNIYHIGL
jgi:hypothetical protein